MEFIYLQPISEIEHELLRHLASRLEATFGHPCKIALPIRLPELSYSAGRHQYDAEIIVENITGTMPFDAQKLLGVTDVDIFVSGLNFVFGLAAGNAAVISLARLRPEFYGEKKNEHVFRERALKEAIHELGHTFGLRHCSDITCVMHFSNRLEDTDIKGTGFCEKCSAKIRRG